MTMWLLVSMIALCCALKPAKAQDSAPKADEGEKTLHAYRVDFSLNEMEGDKKINTRHYTIDLADRGDREEVKIGTRVPVVTGSFPASAAASGTVSPVINTQFQYIDIGTHIWCALKEHGDALELQAGSEISNIDAGAGHEVDGVSEPVIRQIKISGTTIVVPGKPIVIGGADDPTSNRQFQLEATATKLR